MSLISGHSQSQTAYEPTLWAKLFHSVPHVNITLHPVNPRFNPESDLYLESLGILASIPAAWLITTLVILLIYLCTRCCDTKNSKKRKSRPIRCCLSFFALVTVTALALGFIGNHLMHTGMEEFQRSTQNIHHIVERSQEMAGKYNDVFQNAIEKNLNRLFDGPFQRDIQQDRVAHFEIMDACDVIFHNISGGLEAMDQLRFAIDEPNQRLSIQYVPYWAQAMEKYRWPATMALQALFALFCLLLFVGAIVHSRCVLILFSVCGLFSIILLWLLASMYAGAAVAMADFCFQPTPWVQHMLAGSLDEEVSEYYLQCAPGKANPFESFLSKSQRSITDIDRRVRQISSLARKYYSVAELSPFLDDLEQHAEDTTQLMNDLSRSLRCEPIFKSYSTALVAVCDSGLFGLILMLVSVALSGLLFTLLVWCNSHTWIYFKHKGRYIKVDDQDPYMPLSTIERPRMTTSSVVPGGQGPPSSIPAYHSRRNIHTPPQTPPYAGTLNGHHQSATLRSTPGVGVSPYGHIGGGAQAAAMGHHSHTLGHQHHHGGHQAHHQHPQLAAAQQQRANVLGTLGRNPQPSRGHMGQGQAGGYQGMDNLPATMTLGRRGHYASMRASQVGGVGNEGAAMLGPNIGQYATLNKQCKTLESSDFY